MKKINILLISVLLTCCTNTKKQEIKPNKKRKIVSNYLGNSKTRNTKITEIKNRQIAINKDMKILKKEIFNIKKSYRTLDKDFKQFSIKLNTHKDSDIYSKLKKKIVSQKSEVLSDPKLIVEKEYDDDMEDIDYENVSYETEKNLEPTEIELPYYHARYHRQYKKLAEEISKKRDVIIQMKFNIKELKSKILKTQETCIEKNKEINKLKLEINIYEKENILLKKDYNNIVKRFNILSKKYKDIIRKNSVLERENKILNNQLRELDQT